MTEPTIHCPYCKNEIKLTESLAAPLIEATRLENEKKLAQKDAEFAKREFSLREREEVLLKSKETLDEQVLEKVKQERIKIAAEESKKAKLAASTDIEQKTKELNDLQNILQERNIKLAEAQKAQVDLLKKQRELDDAKRELDLTVEKRIQEGLETTRSQAKKEAEEGLLLKVKEKELTISSMQKQIEDLKRRAEQGSQQLQGEVQELELEALLKSKFPFDSIEPVPKGEHGGDTLQRVVNSFGQSCGTIIWESKRTKNWVDGWLPKLREDQRAAKAEIAIIVTQVLPKGVETFEQVDGVWITHPKAAFPVAMALRHTLLEISSARQSSEGQQTKMEQVYHYMTGTGFRHRLQAIVEAFTCMQTDLEKERRVITGQWDKRRMQIDLVMQATVGMYNDLQGIAGKTLQEIEGLEMPALESPDQN